ncbi:MAG: acyltransferase [Phycisphaeraceae bacterium]|nr:acyltransferase [Phycisphaeraceae bacterium]
MSDARFEGIDYLRALLSVFVVVWHMGGGGRSLIFSTDRYQEHTFILSDLINFHVLLQAVPTFVLVSCFLFASHGASRRRLVENLKRFLILVSFWATTFSIFRAGSAGPSSSVPNGLGELAVTVLTAGHTIYFFFVSLLICQLIVFLIVTMSCRLQILGMILATVMVACLPVLAQLIDCPLLGAYWNPLNFVPYPFVAVLIAQNRDFVRSNKLLLLGMSGAMFILLSIFEWHYSVSGIFIPGQGYAIPTYTRASLVFSGAVIGVVAIDSKIRAPRAINYMAKYSLALYCLHPFLIDPVKRLVVGALSGNSVIATYVAIVAVLLISYLIAPVLRIYLKDRIVL